MKRFFSMVVLVLLSVFSFSSAHAWDDSLFQYSTINTLLSGYYDGDLNFSTLAEHGDLGLGTLNHLDGEMIALDGRFYQVKTDGKVYPVDGRRYTPFAVVTHFDVDRSFLLPSGLDYPALQQVLEKHISNKNHFYAFRIRGHFQNLTVRSVPAQTRPYQPLVDVIKDQVKFQYADQKGTLVGFYTPGYMKGLNIPGFHFHFLSLDRSRGGHVLALETKTGVVEVDEIHEFAVSLPESQAFAELNLSADQKKALDKVEKASPSH